jgi:hypothetical protein
MAVMGPVLKLMKQVNNGCLPRGSEALLEGLEPLVGAREHVVCRTPHGTGGH